jgi:hypothetical protein
VDGDQLTQSLADDADEERTDPADETGQAPDAGGTTGTTRPPSVGQLRRDRKRLSDERQEAVYHLGGLSLDLHRRGLLGDALVSRRAEFVVSLDRKVALLDEELTSADERRRRGRVRTPEPVGYCLSCGAPHLADAAFCSRCGSRIHVPEAESDTQVIPIETDGQ